MPLTGSYIFHISDYAVGAYQLLLLCSNPEIILVACMYLLTAKPSIVMH